VSGANPDSVAVEAAVDLMVVSPGGRLYKSLVETKKATAIDDFDYIGYDPSFAMFLVQVADQDPIEPARDALLSTVENVKSAPITPVELDRVRAKNLKSIDETLNDPQRLGVALSTSIAEGDWRLFFLRRDRWRTVTPADVDRVSTAYFKPSNRTLGEFLPDAKPDRAPAQPAIDVEAMVKDYKGDAAVSAGETFDPTPANLDARAQRFSLANGMKVALLPKTTRGGTVQVAARLHYGDVASVAGKEGEARLTAGMLMRGTTSHSRQEIEDTLDKLRASLNVDGGQTSVAARGQTVRANLAPTLDLLAEVLQRPAFPATELDTLKRAYVTGIEEQRTDPRALAQRTLSRYDNPYPRGDDRYTPTFDEEIADLRAPGVDSLKAFHQKFYGASAGEIAIVGDFDPAEVKTQLEKLFGGWKSPTPFTRVPQPLVVKKPTAIPIETPDKANAYLTGQTSFAMGDRDPEYPAMSVANYIFGGSTNSRLWNRVRQKEGLSYGINTSLRASSFEQSGGLVMAAIFAPENLDKLRTSVSEEMQRVVRDGFTADEVAQGKQALLQERRLARSQDAGLAAGLVEQSYVGRSFAYSGEVDKAIEALTPEQVTAAFRRYVKDNGFVFVFAGDFAKANKQVRAQ
jgi:zinc protease